MGTFAADAGAFIGQLHGGGGGGGGGAIGGGGGYYVGGGGAGGSGGGGGHGSVGVGGPGGAAAEAAAKVRSCVEELALRCVQPMVRLHGFKESHAMQLAG